VSEAVLELSRVAVQDASELALAEERGQLEALVRERVALPVRSGKDPLHLLTEVAEELCFTRVREGVDLVPASDVRPFLLPRLDELLDPENEELRFVLSVEGNEKVSEHAIQQALEKGAWPQNGSVTLEAALLAVELARIAREAARHGESLLARSC
jgi:hypothetical protein